MRGSDVGTEGRDPDLWVVDSCVVRRLEQVEWRALQDLFHRCDDFSRLCAGVDHPPTAARDEFSAVPPGRSLVDKEILGVERDGTLIGVMESVRRHREPSMWWIGLLMLDPHWRGHGIGHRLVDEFVRRAARDGFASVGISVHRVNQPGLRFWKRLGFAEVSGVGDPSGPTVVMYRSTTT